jgi:hypothetical protein
MNNRGVHVRDAAIVEILPAPPVAAIESGAWVAESIINATVEANCGTPITGIPRIEPIGKGPVARSPKKTYLRGKNPEARDPVVAVNAVCPVTRFPEIAGTWTKRLAIDGKDRWADADRNSDADLCGWACAKRDGNGQDRDR